MTYHRVCNKSKTTGATGGAGMTTRLQHSSPRFLWVRVAQSLVFCLVLCVSSLFVQLSFEPLYIILQVTVSDYLLGLRTFLRRNTIF
jgi:hypothetical protein